jgi:hypothetical protein
MEGSYENTRTATGTSARLAFKRTINEGSAAREGCQGSVGRTCVWTGRLQTSWVSTLPRRLHSSASSFASWRLTAYSSRLICLASLLFTSAAVRPRSASHSSPDRLFEFLSLSKTTDFGRFERLSVNPWIKRVCIPKQLPPHSIT